MGKNGTNGASGKDGANGTTVAYAIIQPTSPTAATLIGPSNILTVSVPREGVYCITPAAVSPEVSYSSGNVPGVIAVNAQHATNCPSAPYEVDTYSPSTLALAGGFAFTIAIP
jgi:hypothetical protein